MSKRQPYQPNKQQIKFLRWVRNVKLKEHDIQTWEAIAWFCNNTIINGYSDEDKQNLNDMREMFIDKYKKR